MNAKGAAAVILGILFLFIFVMAVILVPVSWPATAPQVTAAGTALWKGRTGEVVFQGFIILAGIISILLLLGPGRTREGPP